MIKKIIFITAIALSSLAIFAGSTMAASMLKVAVVDLQGALNATTEGLAAKETLKNKHLAKRQQMEKMKAELETLEEKIKSPVISKEAEADLKEKYLNLRAQYVEFVSQAKEEEERENQKYTARIVDGLLKIVQEVAAAENYSLVLQNNVNSVVYFEESMDITDRVIKIYNERYQAGGAQ
ncbi:MAG: OmpH family outer membrane protein [Pseudomonadota bacterium]